MATIYLNLGCQVTILELLPDILTTEDEEIRRAMKILLGQRGARLHLEVATKEVAVRGEEVKVQGGIFQDRDNRMASFGCRIGCWSRPLAGADIIEAGIDPAKTGTWRPRGVSLRSIGTPTTSLPGVYAIGNLVGGVMLFGAQGFRRSRSGNGQHYGSCQGNQARVDTSLYLGNRWDAAAIMSFD